MSGIPFVPALKAVLLLSVDKLKMNLGAGSCLSQKRKVHRNYRCDFGITAGSLPVCKHYYRVPRARNLYAAENNAVGNNIDRVLYSIFSPDSLQPILSDSFVTVYVLFKNVLIP